jgi:hypothetical protein
VPTLTVQCDIAEPMLCPSQLSTAPYTGKPIRTGNKCAGFLFIVENGYQRCTEHDGAARYLIMHFLAENPLFESLS